MQCTVCQEFNIQDVQHLPYAGPSRPLRDEAWERWHGPSRVGRPCLSASLFAVTFGSGDLPPVAANFFSVLFPVSPEPDSKISNADLSFKIPSRGRPLLANWNCPELELSRVE